MFDDVESVLPKRWRRTVAATSSCVRPEGECPMTGTESSPPNAAPAAPGPRDWPLRDRQGFTEGVIWGFRQAMAGGARRLLCTDPDFQHWPLDDRALLDELGRWLRLPQRRLVMLARPGGVTGPTPSTRCAPNPRTPPNCPRCSSTTARSACACSMPSNGAAAASSTGARCGNGSTSLRAWWSAQRPIFRSHRSDSRGSPRSIRGPVILAGWTGSVSTSVVNGSEAASVATGPFHRGSA